METIALITARGGSKGIPQKNIRLVRGKPLIAWTIQAALASTHLTRVVVSTDDEAIAAVSREWGADVPFMRPPELAQDHSDHLSVVLHALDWLNTHGSTPDYLLLLQPTSPLRLTEDIDAVIQLAQTHQAEAVVSVCEAPSHPYLTKKISSTGHLENFIETDLVYLRRQDLPPAYAFNGALYLIRCAVLRTQRTLLPPQTYPYIMPSERSLDVDTLWDLKLAEWILQEREHES